MDNFSAFTYFKAIGILFLLLAFLVGLLFLIKRFSPTPFNTLKQNRLKILGNINLGPKKSLVLVQFLDSLLLIGVTESNISLLKEVSVSHDQDFETLFKEKLSDRSSNTNK